MTGCASPELGAHVLVKLMNRSGYELGSAVVSLTHLLHTSTEEVRATHFPSVSYSYLCIRSLSVIFACKGYTQNDVSVLLL